MAHSIGEVARLAHVSVRTLRHYDEIDLLRPSARSEAGYRLYSEDDLARLQQVLLYRELGLPLRDIGVLMSDPAFERREALLRQRSQLAPRERLLRAIIGLIDRTLATTEGGATTTHEEMFEVVGDFDPAAHEAEAEERWGGTGAYEESRRRTTTYTRTDWLRFKRESDEVSWALAALMDEGAHPDGGMGISFLTLGHGSAVERSVKANSGDGGWARCAAGAMGGRWERAEGREPCPAGLLGMALAVASASWQV